MCANFIILLFLLSDLACIVFPNIFPSPDHSRKIHQSISVSNYSPIHDVGFLRIMFVIYKLFTLSSPFSQVYSRFFLVLMIIQKLLYFLIHAEIFTHTTKCLRSIQKLHIKTFYPHNTLLKRHNTNNIFTKHPLKWKSSG